MKPEDLLEASMQELIEALDRFNNIYDDVQQNLVMIRSELLDRLKDAKKDGEIVGEYSVKRAKRINFKTSMEEAEELGAVKQAIDSTKLRKLYSSGVKVPGVSITEYLSVRKLQQDAKETD